MHCSRMVHLLSVITASWVDSPDRSRRFFNSDQELMVRLLSFTWGRVRSATRLVSIKRRSSSRRYNHPLSVMVSVILPTELTGKSKARAISLADFPFLKPPRNSRIARVRSVPRAETSSLTKTSVFIKDLLQKFYCKLGSFKPSS